MYVTPECEGYFMCATIQIVKNDGHKHIVVSAPLPVYGKSFVTDTGNTLVHVFALIYVYI